MFRSFMPEDNTVTVSKILFLLHPPGLRVSPTFKQLRISSSVSARFRSIIETTILDKINGTSGPPLPPPFQ